MDFHILFRSTLAEPLQGGRLYCPFDNSVLQFITLNLSSVALFISSAREKAYGNYKSRNSTDEGGADSQAGRRFPGR